MRLVATAVVISVLWLACAYAPASGLDDNPTALAALEAKADQTQRLGTDVFSAPSSSAR